MGGLPSIFFTCEKSLLPKTKVRTKLFRARLGFYTLSENLTDNMKIVDCSLFTRRISFAELNH